MPVMLPPVPSAVDFSEKKVLIADDVADTGKTIELVQAFVAGHVAEVRSAVVYEKPTSLVKCDCRRRPPWCPGPPTRERRMRPASISSARSDKFSLNIMSAFLEAHPCPVPVPSCC
jgi:hypoxanthine phosphoribosyltransferase